MIVSAYTSSLSLSSSSSSAQEGGGSAIKEGAIKIDRSVTIGVVGRSFERATLVREQEEESGWILSFLFPSFCVSVVPPMLRRRLKTVLFRKAGCYLRGDVLGLNTLETLPWPLHQPESPIQIFVSLSFTILSRVGSFGGV